MPLAQNRTGNETAPPALLIEQLRKSFGPVRALDGIDLRVENARFCSILGPSGCGKTTLLRVVAGFEKPDEGRVLIQGKDAADLPPRERSVNTVFQSYALFPHLNVARNIEFGLRMRGVVKTEAKRRVASAMEMVAVQPLAERYPDQLSGGQKQRVALARAIVNEPRVLLLDEPLAAVDAQLRKQLQQELRALQQCSQITFVYVTHDQEEALTMSDHVVLMNHGRIEQQGSPRDLYESPRSRFAASFLGASNLLQGKWLGLNQFVTAFGALALTHASGKTGPTIAVRAEHIQVTAQKTEPNCFQAIIEESSFNGAQTEMFLRLGETRLRVLIPNTTRTLVQASPGATLWIHIPPESVIPLED